MTWVELESRWERLSSIVLTQWPKLTVDDLDYVRMSRGRMVSRLAERYGLEEDAAADEVDAWLDQLH